jgi:hypothetical protein
MQQSECTKFQQVKNLEANYYLEQSSSVHVVPIRSKLRIHRDKLPDKAPFNGQRSH